VPLGTHHYGLHYGSVFNLIFKGYGWDIIWDIDIDEILMEH
jgi:hypothetical protein